MNKPAASRHWQILAAFAAIYLLWGSTYLGIRFALETLPPFAIAGVRFVIAGGILIALARRRGAAAPTRANWRAALVMGSLMFLVANGAIMLAETRVHSGPAALIVATVPLWIALLGWMIFQAERPTARVFVGLVTGFAGIVLLVGPGKLGHQVDLAGAALLVFSSLAWAFASLLSRRLALPASPLLGAGMNLLCGGLMLMAVSLITGEWAALDMAVVSAKSLLAVVYLIVFGSIIGFSSYMWLLSVVPANRVATYAYVNPVVAVFLGWALGGEPVTPQTLLAAAVIIAAVVLITTAPRHSVSVALPRVPGFGTRLRLLMVKALR